ncbi:hypothetical protein JKP88DRAFT_301373 [Tribonema minus]|uniref:Uncharacterized protein n=1 Tax=Tribonema minus TaxID=303371 RepID=A0A835ZFK9_9STRA|nr:hypothetical protein JKP88DRAFT_301373 [Tribonema minus]
MNRSLQPPVLLLRVLRVARYYEAQGDLGAAGRHYAACAAGSTTERSSCCCSAARRGRGGDRRGRACNDMLTHTLIDYLMGETGGVLKDPHHIYRLYLALGNYQQAHAVLYEAIRRLEDQRARVPQALLLRRGARFWLLHSYRLAKLLALGAEP